MQVHNIHPATPPTYISPFLLYVYKSLNLALNPKILRLWILSYDINFLHAPTYIHFVLLKMWTISAAYKGTIFNRTNHKNTGVLIEDDARGAVESSVHSWVLSCCIELILLNRGIFFFCFSAEVFVRFQRFH